MGIFSSPERSGAVTGVEVIRRPGENRSKIGLVTGVERVSTGVKKSVGPHTSVLPVYENSHRDRKKSYNAPMARNDRARRARPDGDRDRGDKGRGNGNSRD